MAPNVIVALASLFLIPVFEAPPPPPKTSWLGDINADEYTGNAARECGVCRGRISSK